MSARITFGAELGYAMQIRGLTLTDVARRSRVATATASAATRGRPVNVATALRLARTVAACPIVPELLEWVERPPVSALRMGDSRERSDGAATDAASAASTSRSRMPRAARQPRRERAEGQLRIAID
jgi:transcriptional regulator with XRE-family HTH domain